jgi:hypothetical protein
MPGLLSERHRLGASDIQDTRSVQHVPCGLASTAAWAASRLGIEVAMGVDFPAKTHPASPSLPFGIASLRHQGSLPDIINPLQSARTWVDWMFDS